MSWAFAVLAAAVAGLMFAPVFGVPALLFVVGVPTAVLVVVSALVARKPRLAPWRALLLAVAGLLAVVESLLWSSTIAGLPTGETLRALALGVTDSWQLALQSTWPARPDAQLLLFVPLLVVAASVLGTALLEWFRSPLLALMPSLAVVVLAQLYSATSGWAAVLAALAYVAVAGALLAVARGEPPVRRDQGEGRPVADLLPPTMAAAITVVCAVLAGALVPSPAPRYTLKDDFSAPVSDVRVTSPLDDIVHRLTHPDVEVFRARGSSAGRWPVVVLTKFDGINWSPGGRYRRLGTGLRPSPAVTVPLHRRGAEIEPADMGGPWLPSQTWPAGVSGAAPLIEEDQGSLLVPGPGDVGEYTLTWWEPEISAEALRGAEIDPDAAGGLAGVGPVPDGIAELADRAVHGLRPTFDAALELERHFREEYQLATGKNLPTGHSWPQLRRFLLKTKRGTSEQFAAAYVALARIRGIPARLVVGYADGGGEPVAGGFRVIRNGDVLAWPEVAVEGVGWVPLDPTGSSRTSDAASGSLDTATAQARVQLPPPEDLRNPPVAPSEPTGESAKSKGGAGIPVWLLAIPLGLVLLAPGCVPAVTALRAWRRRRRPGAGAVIGAWEEVRDRMRAHGVPVSAGMTVRDLAIAASQLADEATVDGVRRLGGTVDLVLWSGAPQDSGSRTAAWESVREVRLGLARLGLRARLRAAVNPRVLGPPR